MKKYIKFKLTEKDVELLITMENLIGCNERKIFNKKGEFKYEERMYPKDGSPSYLKEQVITQEDFYEFWRLIDRILMAGKDERSQNLIMGMEKKIRKKFIKGELKNDEE